MKIPDKSAYKILERYEIEIAKYVYVRDLSSAVKELKKLSYPMILKIDSPQIIHKSDSGCVQTAYSKEDFKEKFKLLMKNAKKITKKIHGVVIQEKISGKEMMIGSKIDKQFGPVICFGLGGIYVEALHDVSFRLIPLKEDDAIHMIKDSKAYNILTSRKKSNITAVIDTILKVSQLIEKEKIREMDINPLMVNKKGAYAVDVRMIK